MAFVQEVTCLCLRASVFALIFFLPIVRASTGQVSFHQLYKQGAQASVPRANLVSGGGTVPVQPLLQHTGPAPPVDPARLSSHLGKGPPAPQPSLSCPQGFRLAGRYCEGAEYVEATPRCQKKGDVYQDGVCVFLEELKAYAKCPEGTQGDGKKCYSPRFGPTEAFCPEEYDISPDGKSCLRATISKPQHQCALGFVQKYDQCYKETRTSGVPSCPLGFQLINEGKPQCVAVDRVPMEARCKEKDYVLEGGFCVRNATRPPNPSCPREFKDEGGLCVRRETVAATVECRDGVLNKKGCTILTHEVAVPSCRKDFMLEGTVCKRVDTKPASRTCPQGFKMKDNACMLVELLEPERVCPQGTVAKDKHCLQAVFAQAEASCDKGAELINGQCVQTEIRPARVDCKFGACKPTETRLPPEVFCPPGTQLEGRYCLSFTVEQTETVCKKSGAIPGPEGCRRVDSMEPMLTCPSGWKLFSGSCVKEEEAPFQYICPPGMQYTGKQCEGERRFKPEVVCPRNFVVAEDGLSCVNVELQDPIPTCPPAHFLSGGLCLPAPPQKAAGGSGGTAIAAIAGAAPGVI